MRHFHIDDTEQSGLSIMFELQPIVGAPTMHPYGYELLYRGPRPVHWPVVDGVILNYLRRRPAGPGPTLFVNLSNETLLSHDLADYVQLSHRNNTYFELTETLAVPHDYRDISRRVNSFTAEGLRFAIDDFGSGLDGLHRYSSLAEVAFVKLDRVFLQQARMNPTARRIVEALVREWSSANTSTIAEGIESRADLEFAMHLGVQMFQGYFIDAHHPARNDLPAILTNPPT